MSGLSTSALRLWKHGLLFDRLVLIAYSAAFLGATYNHLSDLVRLGWLGYSSAWAVPFAMNLFWTSLTIIDPLCVLLLLLSVEAGTVAYCAVMVSDVTVNWIAFACYWNQPLSLSYGLFMQSGFLLFLIVTAPILCSHLRRLKA